MKCDPQEGGATRAQGCLPAFKWSEHDVRLLLPAEWQPSVLSVATEWATERTLVPTSVTSREASPDIRIPTLGVGGKAVRRLLPWLYSLYQGQFQSLASQAVGES